MKIRIAERIDLPAIVNIYNQAISAQATAALELVAVEDRQAWFDDHPSEKYPIIVAESDGSILGYLHLSAYRPGRSALQSTAEVSYFVDYEHHNQGVASELLETCIRMCPSLEINTIFAILLENNAASIHLLKKYKFEQWAHLPGVAEIGGMKVGQVYLGRKINQG
ncbi:MAG: N-acetyltransferase [Candidatus Marinimicrobia bacterium]|jgi:phosphinothricin acetyltransferase|nr:N-acetyltransferase [Candidatus Neomarinimicrobiota bacterium]MBT3632456.1 N-acetyltransferase [Candidatus Neomarinimicrobiota bacterium]MBT3826043.1 N-acetyltransferase [Candidatus Neomarinimicrobiota bacterium]MBT4132279.1 N-acetyltransferase [Candidatus Neomarinimicrobiota bacterium]MBT4296564.1 N-acetyltransferase [Candidatus Neomarinimicrobiota bacterium]